LQKIMPHIHVSLVDTLRYIASSVRKDMAHAASAGVFSDALNIIRYRWSQYFGAWAGNHQHRTLSRNEKERYFFPD
jgi:hypothetical protein